MGAFDDLIAENKDSGGFDDLVNTYENQDSAIVRGTKNAISSGSLSVMLANGDLDSVAKQVKEIDDYKKKNPGSAEQKNISEAWRKDDSAPKPNETRKEQMARTAADIVPGVANVAGVFADDWRNSPNTWEAIKSVGRNTKAMGDSVIEQIPNMVAPMAGLIGGGAAGGAAGSAVPIVGNVAGAVAGGFLGASTGNAVVETGNMLLERLHKAKIDPQDTEAVKKYVEEHRADILKEGLIKGSVIGAVDTATMGLAGKLLMGPAKAAAGRALVDMGVDVADKAAVKTAMQSPEFAARIAADAEYKAATTGVQGASRKVGAAALEPAGEFTGELVGTGVATGEWDVKNAAVEAASSVGQSAATYAGQRAYAGAKYPFTRDKTITSSDGPVTVSYPDTNAQDEPVRDPTIDTRIAELDQLGSERELTKAEKAELGDLLMRAEAGGFADNNSQVASETGATSTETQAPANETAASSIETAPAAQPSKVTWFEFLKEKGVPVRSIKRDTPEWTALKAEFTARNAAVQTSIKVDPVNVEPFNPVNVDPTGKDNLQNRDRSSDSSVDQMQSIVRKPDYMRLGPSRTPDSGAPMVFANGDADKITAIPDSSLGGYDTAVMSDGQRVPFRYAVVDASKVEPSNFADGRTNERYASAEPGTIKALNNGRTAGIRGAYEAGNAGDYKAELLADVRAHGVSAEAIEATPNPMLVRIYSEKDNTGGMGARSQGQGLGMSPTELARQDSTMLDSAVLSDYVGGDIASAANRDFVRAFVGKMKAAGQDASPLMDANGEISVNGVRRIQAALVQRAYGDSDLVSTMFESTDNDIKAIGEALKEVAGAWANMRDSAAQGLINPAADITGNLMQMVNLVRQVRAQGGSIYDAANQADIESGQALDDLSIGLLRLFFSGQYMTRLTGKQKIADALSQYVAGAMQTSVEPDMFGVVVTPLEILQTIQKDSDGQATESAKQPTGGVAAGVGASIAGSEESGAGAGQGGNGSAGSGAGQSGQDAQNVNGQQASQSDQQGQEGDAGEGLDLQGQSQAELDAANEKAVEQEKADKAKAAADAAKDKADRERAEVQSRNEAANANFILGQSAEDNLSGQGDMLSGDSAPANNLSFQDRANLPPVDPDVLEEQGEPIETAMDAERRFAAGERIFAFHEMDELPKEILNTNELEGYSPDQLLALPVGFDAAAPSAKKKADPKSDDIGSMFDDILAEEIEKDKAISAKPKTKSDPVTIKFYTAISKPMSFDFGTGKINITASVGFAPDAYAKSYGTPGGIINFELRGEGLNSETGFKSVSGVIYQGEMDNPRFAQLTERIARENAKPEGKPLKSKAEKTANKASKPTAKERQVEAEQKMFDLLGARVGDTITFSQDIGYISANKPLVISSISRAGEMSVTDPERGSSTTEKLGQIQAQAGRGLTWSVTPAEKPQTEKEAKAAKAKAEPVSEEKKLVIAITEVTSKKGTVGEFIEKNGKATFVRAIELGMLDNDIKRPDSRLFGTNKFAYELQKKYYDFNGTKLTLKKDEAKPKTEKAAKQQRTAGQAAASAAKNTASGLTNAIDGLGALFGGKNKGTLGSGPVFNEETYAQAKPLFQAAIANLKDAGTDIKEAMRAIIRMVMDKFGAQAAQEMKPYVVRFIDDQGKQNVSGTDASVERNRSESAPQSAVGDSVSSGAGGSASGSRAPSGQAAGASGRGQSNDSGVSSNGSFASGDGGDQRLYSGKSAELFADVASGAGFSERGSDVGITGVPPESIPANQVASAANKSATKFEREARQREADKVGVKLGDIDNIRETLPNLLPGQQDDVLKTEQRFAKPTGYGMLFTNGTGTGKTFTGLGVIKRFARQGKDSILIVVPDDKIAADWIESGKSLGLDVTKLQSTQDAGRKIVITTYANLGDNDALAGRQWDLVVADEAHSLMQSADGKVTKYLSSLRAITYHPDGYVQRYTMLNRADIERSKEIARTIAENDRLASADDTMDQMREGYQRQNAKLEIEQTALRAKLAKALEAAKAEVADRQGASRTRLAALSATPFAYEKTIDWANGYLFDYNDGRPSDTSTSRGYNQGDNREQFFMQNFGYTMRYNKLTEPDGKKVDRGLLQRNFNTMLKKAGSLSGRMLDVAADYDRRFVLVESAIGNRIDEALSWLDEQAQGGTELSVGFSRLRETLDDSFDYLSRRYLLEAIKATEAVPIVKAHLALNRKVVVFHDYKKGGGFNPFDVKPATAKDDKSLRQAIEAFREQFKDLVETPLSQFPSPINVFMREFPDVLLINGDEKKSDLLARYERFQDDNTGPLVMLVQSAKNKGWSGHDTTGKNQRVLINLGQPTAPTLAIQQEGRIYRTGQISNAIMRYLNTGTNWERWAFATTIATRASAAENLGMGELSRALKDSFISAFEESDTYAPGHEGEGTGGKERDKASNNALTAYDRAKTFYYATQKKNSKTKAQEGADYYATPEPLGFKMAEWLGARSGEMTLEPSAGHGAIARWLPETTGRTVIEPSTALRTRLAMVMNPDEDRIITSTFEDLNVVNKFDGIVMNPPFGVGGKTAIEHLAKAVAHLREGGRIVALIPTGPAADKRFDAWFNGVTEKNGKEVRNAANMHFTAEIILPRVAFERAGTAVASRIVVLDKYSDANKAPRVISPRDLSQIETIDELFTRIENMVVPERTAPIEPAKQESVAPNQAAAKQAAAKPAEPTGTLDRGDSEVILHTTAKGKIIRGIILKNTTLAKAKEIDPYTFKKDGGFFVREKYLKPEGGVPQFSRRNDAKVSLPETIIAHPVGALKNHPDYAAAKSGDVAAATRVAGDLLFNEVIQKVKTVANGKNLIFVPVDAVEASGKNMIPSAMAETLAYDLGGSVSQDIVQASSPKRTSLDGLDRIFNSPVFDGEVQPGREYFLVDDTLTQGGTFAALASHITQNGGIVAGSLVLTGKQYSAKLALDDSLLNKLREKYGDLEQDFRGALGYGFDGLTQSEARYLASFKPSNEVRDRIIAARVQAGARTNENNNRGEAQEPSNEPNFSRVVNNNLVYRPVPPLSARGKQVETLAAATSLAWAKKPKIIVVENMQSPLVPLEVQQYDQLQKSNGATGEPQGFFYLGKIYLVASELKTDKDIIRVLKHEGLGHYGLQGVFGTTLNGILDQIAVARPDDVKERADAYGLDLTDIDQRRFAAEEVLAVMAEKNPQLGFVQRAIAAIRKWLRANVPGFKDLKLTDEEIIRDYLIPARQFVENGIGRGNPNAMPWFSRGAKNSLSANIDRGIASLDKAVDEKSTVHRAMYRDGLGWIDFVWGDAGTVLPSGKTKGGMGISHILEARMRKDNLTEEGAKNVLCEMVRTVAAGTETKTRKFVSSSSINIEHDGYRVALTKKNGSNAWSITAFEIAPDANAEGNDSRISTKPGPTSSRTQDGAGAVASDATNVATRQDITENGSPAGADSETTLPKFSRTSQAITDDQARYLMVEARTKGYNSFEELKDAEPTVAANIEANWQKKLANPSNIAKRADDIINKKVASFRPLEKVASTITKVTGVEKAALATYNKVGDLLEMATESTEFGRTLKAGLVSDYGLPSDVIDQRASLQGRQRVQLREAGALVAKLGTLTRDESRIVYEWMNEADPKVIAAMVAKLPADSIEAIKELQVMIDRLSQEAIALNQLTPEAYDRNKYAYLHRNYAKYLAELSPKEKTNRAKAISILGDQYKGRGITLPVTMRLLANVAPEWWKRKFVEGKADSSLIGEKLVRLEKRANAGEGTVPMEGIGDRSPGRVLAVAYYPANEPLPARFADWTVAGVFEVRDTKGDKLIVWRDYTKAEREKMGEVDEAKFAIIKTLHGMIHDVEAGRYLDWIGKHYGKIDGDKVDGTIVKANEGYGSVFKPGEWVLVPDTKIPGTKVLKYGGLAGKYIPGPIWNDVRQTVNGQFNPFGKTYSRLLGLWKTGKTALSSSVHMNNVMANFIMADWHDVGAAHLTKALRIMLAAHDRQGKGILGSVGNVLARGGITDREAAVEILNRYRDSGGELGNWATQELKREQLDPLLAELEKEIGANPDAVDVQVGVFSAFQYLLMLRLPSAFSALKGAWSVKTVATEAKSLIDLYQSEDEVFRLAAWLKAKEDGAKDIDAGSAARKSFLDYNINAPWIQAMRHTAFPFVSYTYRAVPMMLEIVGKKPHKILKMLAFYGALNAFGYLISGGDEDDERKMLPDEKSGKVFGVVPKLVRMPWNDAHDSPVFLDVRRFIPLGDLFDFGQGHSAIPIPPSMMPGGPLMLAAEVLLNKSAFTGKAIAKETDTATEHAEKVVDYLFKAFAPNILGIPGTYATDAVTNASNGVTDTFGRELSLPQAILSSVGIKLASYPKDVLQRNLDSKALAEMAEVNSQMFNIARQYQMKKINDKEYMRLLEEQHKKLEKIGAEHAKKVN